VFDSVMFRGAQIFSDDTMLPESMRGFAPVIRGIARTNATVTVKQNGYTVYQTYVAPGSFEIRDLYPTSASGDLDIVVTEADGSVQHFVQPFSAVPVMLREGRVKYALSAGEYRTTKHGAETPHLGWARWPMASPIISRCTVAFWGRATMRLACSVRVSALATLARCRLTLLLPTASLMMRKTPQPRAVLSRAVFENGGHDRYHRDARQLSLLYGRVLYLPGSE
jgi:hypothetical protein